MDKTFCKLAEDPDGKNSIGRDIKLISGVCVNSSKGK